MPEQRERRNRERLAAAGTGHWQVLFETQNELDWRAHLRHHRARPQPFDWANTRIDTLCGRVTQPTTYRLSLFVPAGPSDRKPAPG